MENALIDIRDVYKIYNEGYENEVRALDGVTLSVTRGEYLAIVGASGSGKSTLMNILGCLDVPTYGEYILDGEYVIDMYDSELARIRNKLIGFIFQGFNLLNGLTALENVELPLIYQGVHGGKRRDMAMDALDRVGLYERMDHRPGQMSGGQQQRVAIARALATNPSIILADEPTGNLDSRTGEHVIQILAELNKTGTTVVLITHDNAIAQVSKRTVRIKDGRVVEDTAVGRGNAS
ncbi:MAG: ABC transporter ATP-binding protein [Oscillospiraceae bacterium]|jgi:putative ABC transport system ATP-binding protein|nr:ABC transporter ATP-binding protein [Oscillospiraceae bacterium]